MIKVTVFNGNGDQISDDAALTILEALLHRPDSDISMRVDTRYSDFFSLESGKIFSVHFKAS